MQFLQIIIPRYHNNNKQQQQEQRSLQLGTGVLERYQVGQSKIDFTGVYIELIYPVSDMVPDNSIEVVTFSDTGCSVDITGNNYLKPEITYDDNPNPTGEKNRFVTVVYTIDPKEIQDEAVWIEKADSTVFLSFCSAIKLYNGDISDPNAAAMATLDTNIYLQVNFEGGFDGGVAGGSCRQTYENAQELYLVEGFICDESNEPLESERPMVQGEIVRVCVRPTSESLADGIYMRRVDSFTFYREKDDGTQITQTALTDGVSANSELTSLTCDRGSEICSFTTLLKSDFYFRAGIIFGYGEAWLQVGVCLAFLGACVVLFFWFLHSRVQNLTDVLRSFSMPLSLELDLPDDLRSRSETDSLLQWTVD